jgi:TPR repeat protein
VQGDAEAQMEVGLALFTGQDMAKNELAGCVWLEAAAKGGVAEAQFELGARHVQFATSRVQAGKDETRIMWDAQVLSCSQCVQYLQHQWHSILCCHSCCAPTFLYSS